MSIQYHMICHKISISQNLLENTCDGGFFSSKRDSDTGVFHVKFAKVFKSTLPLRKVPPPANPKTDPNPNPNPNRGTIFLGGNCPDTLFCRTPPVAASEVSFISVLKLKNITKNNYIVSKNIIKYIIAFLRKYLFLLYFI